MARAAQEHASRTVRAVRDLRLRRWVQVAEPVRMRTEVAGDGDEVSVALLVWRESATPGLSRFETVAVATVSFADQVAPAPLAPLDDSAPAPDPYTAGFLFHGPAFRYLTSLRIGPAGSCGVLDAARGWVPPGLLHQGLLDAAIHVIPHYDLWRWSPEIASDLAGFPLGIESLQSFGPLPTTGEVTVQARFAGFDDADRAHPLVDLHLLDGRALLVAIRLVGTLVPKGRIAAAPPDQRRAFLRDRAYAGGAGLSVTDDSGTRISAADVDAFDWLPGTVAELYGLPRGTRGRDRLAEIAVRDHVARRLAVHPSTLDVSDHLTSAWPAGRPAEALAVRVNATEPQAWIVDGD
jgi:hypothetical protein